MHTLFIDPSNKCNLHCPDCPTGREDLNAAKKLLDLQLFENILLKIRTENLKLSHICLDGWTDSFIHPRINDLISLCHKYGHPVHISTNLDFPRNVVMRGVEANLILVTVAGFTQRVQEKYRVGSQIDKVFGNLEALATAGARVLVSYLQYVDNQTDEFLFKNYATSLGIGFQASPAKLMPIEAYFTPHPGGKGTKHLLHSVRGVPLTPNRCRNLKNQIALDCDGYVRICGNTYTQFVDHIFVDSFKEIDEKRQCWSFCRQCAHSGALDYYNDVTSKRPIDLVLNIYRKICDKYPAVRRLTKRGW